MKFVNVAFSLLLASVVSADQEVIHANFPGDSIATTLTNLRGSDNIEEETRNVDVETEIESRHLATTRRQGWLDAHNTRRKKYQVEYGGSYVSVSWSDDLKNQALALATEMANNKCTISNPQSMNFGINSSARFGYSAIPTPEWVLAQWETKLNSGYPSNGATTQVLWSNTKYIGCADSFKSNSNSSKNCSVTICLYSKAGNCNMNKYSNWKDAVVKGPGCGKCPSDFPNC